MRWRIYIYTPPGRGGGKYGVGGYVRVVEFIHLVFTRMPGESYHKRLRSLLLCLCDILRAN